MNQANQAGYNELYIKAKVHEQEIRKLLDVGFTMPIQPRLGWPK